MTTALKLRQTKQSAKSKSRLLIRVARRVKHHRLEKSMPRRALADKTGISECYLCQLEIGKANISILLLENIAAALDVPMTNLLKSAVR